MTRHCRSRAGARHGMCELTHGMAGERHAMCESAFMDFTERDGGSDKHIGELCKTLCGTTSRKN